MSVFFFVISGYKIPVIENLGATLVSDLTPYQMISGLTLSQTIPGFYLSAVESFENTVVKGETADNSNFSFFPQCFLHVTFFHFN